MTDRARRIASLLGRLRPISDQASYDALIEELKGASQPVIVSFLNAHAVNLAWESESFAETLARADLLLRDGIGVSLLLRLMGKGSSRNMNGTDFTPALAGFFAGAPVAVFGTQSPYLERAAEKLRAGGGAVVVTRDGFLAQEAYLEALKDTPARLVILGMGMPKQENVAAYLQAQLSGGVVIVNGGAILDFLADRFPRAPQAWQMMKLEWLFRLLQEPGRLWRRYLLGGATFAFRAVLLRQAAHAQAGPR